MSEGIIRGLKGLALLLSGFSLLAIKNYLFRHIFDEKEDDKE